MNLNDFLGEIKGSLGLSLEEFLSIIPISEDYYTSSFESYNSKDDTFNTHLKILTLNDIVKEIISLITNLKDKGYDDIHAIYDEEKSKFSLEYLIFESPNSFESKNIVVSFYRITQEIYDRIISQIFNEVDNTEKHTFFYDILRYDNDSKEGKINHNNTIIMIEHN